MPALSAQRQEEHCVRMFGVQGLLGEWRKGWREGERMSEGEIMSERMSVRSGCLVLWPQAL